MSTDSPPLDQARLAALRAKAGIPALAAAATHRDGRSVAFADGLRALGQEALVTTSDCWHLGSITKSMTSTLVARCVEAGAVSWDDTVGSVLGAAIADMRAEYRDATFRHLLSHRAGLQPNIEKAQFLKFPRESNNARSDRIGWSRTALQQMPLKKKEQMFAYSNSGYIVAAAMLESKLGAPWETLLREHVFAPLGMSTAGYGAPGTPGAYDHPVGHLAQTGGVLTPLPPGGPATDNPAVIGPAGRVHAAFADVLTYLAAHRDRSAFLSRESWEILHTPPFGGDYAMGWVRRGDTLWHNGSNMLWYAEVMIDMARGVVAVAAANDGRPDTRAPVGVALLGTARILA